MVTSVLTKLPHRWRNFGMIFTLCIIIYFSFQYIESNVIKEKDTPFLFPSKKDDSSSSSSSSKDKITQHIHGIDNFISRLPRLQVDFDLETKEEKQTRELRREAIKKSFLYGWNGYKTYAMGADELKPLSNEAHNPFGGLGATMVDSLSTMLVMELLYEFDHVLPLIENIKVHVDEDLSVFETIIRCMGGLLSAYELTDHPKRKILLDKAEEIGLALLPAFDTPYGLPFYKYNPVTYMSSTNFTYLADAGTVQLEFFTLSYHTGNMIFAKKAQAITDFIDTAEYFHGIMIPGLYPNKIDVVGGYFYGSTVSFGAMGDSAYEYFLKQYILSDGQEFQFARMYEQSIDSMKHYMLYQLPGSKFLYLPPYDTQYKTIMNTMDHLTCFVPGMLAMGSKLFNRPDDMTIAKGLLDTCVHMYRSMSKNLSPEIWGIGDNVVPYNPLTYTKTEEELKELRQWWYLNNTKVVKRPKASAQQINHSKIREMQEVLPTPEGMIAFDARYLLRPETVESLFVLYRITGDPIYQEYGWVIYEALEKHCKTSTAYASLKNVVEARKRPPGSPANQLDSMESFLFAETFKYLYLLFSPPEVISLDKFVLNTEAHPLLRRSWTLNFKKPFSSSSTS